MFLSEVQSPIPQDIRKLEPKDIRKLDLVDIAIMNQLSHSFKEELIKYVSIDPFTSTPLDNNNDFKYLVVADKDNLSRIVAMIIFSDKSDNPGLDLEKIMNEKTIKFYVSRDDAMNLKYEMMPKDVNNFYAVRLDGMIIGYIMFAFQICGQHK